MADKTDAWMPLWIGAYLADTQHLTRDEHGGYLLLLMAYWRARAALSDDDKRLAAIVKASLAEWKKLRPTMAEFFRIADGVWWHKRVEAEIADADRRKAGAVGKAQAAAAARWGKDSGIPSSNAPSSAPSIPQALPEQCPTPSPTPSLPTEVKEAAPRASRLAADWVLPPEWRAFAERERPELDVERTAALFQDHWKAAPGKDGRKLDWFATWRNWVRKERAPIRNPAEVARVTVPARPNPNGALAQMKREALTPEEREASRKARLAAMAGLKTIGRKAA